MDNKINNMGLRSRHIVIAGVGLLFLSIYCLLATLILRDFLTLNNYAPRRIISTTLPVELLWQSEVDEAISFEPVIFDNQVIVTTNKAIYSLDIVTGNLLWKHIPVNQTTLSPSGAMDTIIYGDYGGRVTAIDNESGAAIWQHKINNSRVSSVIIDDKFIYAATTSTTEVQAIDLQSGQLVWSLKEQGINLVGRGAKLFLWMNKLYVFTTKVYVLDSETGQLNDTIRENLDPSQLIGNRFYADRWVRNVETLKLINTLKSPSYQLLHGSCERFKSPYVFSDDRFYGLGNCGGLYALGVDDNRRKWKYPSDVSGESPIAMYQGLLYVLFRDGEIHAIDPQIGQGVGVLKTNFELPGSVHNASFLSRGLVANEDVLIATFNDKNIWAFCKRPCFDNHKK